MAVVHQSGQGAVLTPVSQGAVQYATVGQSGSQQVTSQPAGKKISVITIE